jgi:hypothetical protein
MSITLLIIANCLGILTLLTYTRLMKRRQQRLIEASVKEEELFVRSSIKNFEALIAEQSWMIANTTNLSQKGEYVALAIAQAFHVQMMHNCGKVTDFSAFELKLIIMLTDAVMTFGLTHQAGLTACCDHLIESLHLDKDGRWSYQFPPDVTACMDEEHQLLLLTYKSKILSGPAAEA